MEFSRQEYWSGLPFLSPGDLSDPEIEPVYPAWQADFLPLSHLGSPRILLSLFYRWEHWGSGAQLLATGTQLVCPKMRIWTQTWLMPEPLPLTTSPYLAHNIDSSYKHGMNSLCLWRWARKRKTCSVSPWEDSERPELADTLFLPEAGCLSLQENCSGFQDRCQISTRVSAGALGTYVTCLFGGTEETSSHCLKIVPVFSARYVRSAEPPKTGRGVGCLNQQCRIPESALGFTNAEANGY